jgi:hypothetical protein
MALTFIALKFGPFSLNEVADATGAESWFYAHPEVGPASPEYRYLKTAFRRAYDPGMRDWQELVLARSREGVVQTLAGLSADAVGISEGRV